MVVQACIFTRGGIFLRLLGEGLGKRVHAQTHGSFLKVRDGATVPATFLLLMCVELSQGTFLARCDMERIVYCVLIL